MGGGYKPQRSGMEAVGHEIREIKRQLDNQRRALLGIGIQIDPVRKALVVADGRSIEVNGGTVTVRDNGAVVAEIGHLTDGAPDDVGMRLVRTDPGRAGSNALRFRGGFIGLEDASGNVVVSDDIDSGQGLGSPSIPLGVPQNTNVATWPATSNTAWTTISRCWLQRQNPGLFWAIDIQADADVTGQVRITVDGTTTIATSPPVTNGFLTWTGTYYWPVGWVFESFAEADVEAQITVGHAAHPTEQIRAQVYALTGVRSGYQLS